MSYSGITVRRSVIPLWATLVETASVEMPLIELIAHGKSANFDGTNCKCQAFSRSAHRRCKTITCCEKSTNSKLPTYGSDGAFRPRHR
jgi:hypothetical protein